MTAPTEPPAGTLDYRQRAAHTALHSNAWAEMVFLEAHISRNAIAEALGYDRHCWADRTQHFSGRRLWKLGVLVRIVAALSETQPRHVIESWLTSSNPSLGEVSPVGILRATKANGHEQAEVRLIAALKSFLEIK